MLVTVDSPISQSSCYSFGSEVEFLLILRSAFKEYLLRFQWHLFQNRRRLKFIVYMKIVTDSNSGFKDLLKRFFS